MARKNPDSQLWVDVGLRIIIALGAIWTIADSIVRMLNSNPDQLVGVVMLFGLFTLIAGIIVLPIAAGLGVLSVLKKNHGPPG